MPTLYDMILRHALYFEGARRQSAKDFGAIVRNLDKEILRAFERGGIDKMTKAEFNRFMAKLRKGLFGVFEKDGKAFDKVTRGLADIETTIYQRIFRSNTGERIAVDKADIYGKAKAADIAATGGTMEKAARRLRDATVQKIETIIRRGYVDKASVEDILANIRGLRSLGYRNGALSQISAWAESYSDTILTHVGSSVRNTVASKYYEEYDWISILDGHTTDICIERAGQRYRYGEGPQPPAHYGCRSETVPVDPEADTPSQSFVDWLKDQPGEFLSDVFKNGRTDLDNVKLIQLDTLKGKLEFILVG